MAEQDAWDVIGIASGEQETVTPFTFDWDAVTVTVAEAVLVVSAADVAVRVTVGGDGTDDGAVYVIEGPVVADSDPQPFAVPQEAAQVTPLAAASFVTVAVKV